MSLFKERMEALLWFRDRWKRKGWADLAGIADRQLTLARRREVDWRRRVFWNHETTEGTDA
jgi:hypothetical protein